MSVWLYFVGALLKLGRHRGPGKAPHNVGGRFPRAPGAGHISKTHPRPSVCPPVHWRGKLESSIWRLTIVHPKGARTGPHRALPLGTEVVDPANDKHRCPLPRRAVIWPSGEVDFVFPGQG